MTDLSRIHNVAFAGSPHSGKTALVEAARRNGRVTRS